MVVEPKDDLDLYRTIAMARNISVWVTNWRATGQQVNVPQYAVDIRAEWTGDDGEHHDRSETVRFPNVLNDVPASWVKEELTDLLFRALRVKAGIDVPTVEMEPRALSVESTLTTRQKIGQWFVRNSSILQWIQRRRDQ